MPKYLHKSLPGRICRGRAEQSRAEGSSTQRNATQRNAAPLSAQDQLIDWLVALLLLSLAIWCIMDNNNTSRATEEEDRGGHDDHQVHGGLGSKRQRQESSSSSSSSSSTSFRSANEDMSSSSSGNDDNDDEDGNEGEESDDDGVGRRRRKVRRTDSRSEEQAEGGAANRRPAVLDKGRAICPYNLLRDISHRQFGLITPGTFRCNRMGSLSLAGRMELAYLLEGHQGCVNSLHFNPSGSLLASGSDDLDIIIWDWKGKKRKLLSYESGHRANVFQVRD